MKEKQKIGTITVYFLVRQEVQRNEKLWNEFVLYLNCVLQIKNIIIIIIIIKGLLCPFFHNIPSCKP